MMGEMRRGEVVVESVCREDEMRVTERVVGGARRNLLEVGGEQPLTKGRLEVGIAERAVLCRDSTYLLLPGERIGGW